MPRINPEKRCYSCGNKIRNRQTHALYCKNCYKRFYDTKVRHDTIMDPVGTRTEEGKVMPEFRGFGR